MTDGLSRLITPKNKRSDLLDGDTGGINGTAIGQSPLASSPASFNSLAMDTSKRQTTHSIQQQRIHQGTSRSEMSRQQQQQQQQQQSQRQHLLSPNMVPGGSQQRRKSTLSANGFFIDYSCTRRRSSAALQQARAQQEREALRAVFDRNQLLRHVVSPVRLRPPSTMVTGAVQRQQQQDLSNSQQQRTASFSVGHDRTSRSNNSLSPVAATAVSGGPRASYCSPSTAWQVAQQYQSLGNKRNSIFLSPSTAVASMAGSRKTSIFDPPGHSLGLPMTSFGGSSLTVGGSSAAHRRRSTMVTSAAGALLAPAVEQAATMMQVSKKAAALRKAEASKVGGSKVSQCVPVIGCSPTSIQASLAALEETRRYEKLLRKLEKHQKKKAKEREREARSRHQSRRRSHHNRALDYGTQAIRGRPRKRSIWRLGLTGGDPSMSGSDKQSFSSDDDEAFERRLSMNHQHQLGLRRKSLRAIKDASSAVLRGVQQTSSRNRRRRSSMRYLEPMGDGLSVTSTLSFVSSQTSLPCAIDEDDDDDYDEDESDISGASEDEYHYGYSGAGQSQSDSDHQQQQKQRKQSIVRKAMHKITGSSRRRPQQTTDHSHSDGNEESHTHINKPLFRQRRKSISVAANLNYLHYYYYLRDNSLDAIDDLPLYAAANGPDAGSSLAAVANTGTPMNEHERRTRLYINFSLARLEILNVKGSKDPATRLAEKLATKLNDSQSEYQDLRGQLSASGVGGCGSGGLESEQDWQLQQQQRQELWANFFDFSRSTDVSLTLSTSSTGLDSSSTSRNSSSLSSPVSTVSSSACIAFRSSCSAASAQSDRVTIIGADQHKPGGSHSSSSGDGHKSSPSITSSLSSTTIGSVSMINPEVMTKTGQPPVFQNANRADQMIGGEQPVAISPPSSAQLAPLGHPHQQQQRIQIPPSVSSHSIRSNSYHSCYQPQPQQQQQDLHKIKFMSIGQGDTQIASPKSQKFQPQMNNLHTTQSAHQPASSASASTNFQLPLRHSHSNLIMGTRATQMDNKAGFMESTSNWESQRRQQQPICQDKKRPVTQSSVSMGTNDCPSATAKANGDQDSDTKTRTVVISRYSSTPETGAAFISGDKERPRSDRNGSQQAHKQTGTPRGAEEQSGKPASKSSAKEPFRFRFSFRSAAKGKLARASEASNSVQQEQNALELTKRRDHRTSMSWDQLPGMEQEEQQQQEQSFQQQRKQSGNKGSISKNLLGFVAPNFSSSGLSRFTMGVHPSTRRSFRQPKQSTGHAGNSSSGLNSNNALQLLQTQQSAEERREASELLEQFEAQMSQAANLAKEAAAASRLASRSSSRQTLSSLGGGPGANGQTTVTVSEFVHHHSTSPKTKESAASMPKTTMNNQNSNNNNNISLPGPSSSSSSSAVSAISARSWAPSGSNARPTNVSAALSEAFNRVQTFAVTSVGGATSSSLASASVSSALDGRLRQQQQKRSNYDSAGGGPEHNYYYQQGQQEPEQRVYSESGSADRLAAALNSEQFESIGVGGSRPSCTSASLRVPFGWERNSASSNDTLNALGSPYATEVASVTRNIQEEQSTSRTVSKTTARAAQFTTDRYSTREHAVSSPRSKY